MVRKTKNILIISGFFLAIFISVVYLIIRDEPPVDDSDLYITVQSVPVDDNGFMVVHGLKN